MKTVRIKLTTYEGGHFIVQPKDIICIQITDAHFIYGKKLPDGRDRENNILNKIVITGGHSQCVNECLSDIEKLIAFAIKNSAKFNEEDYIPYAEFVTNYDDKYPKKEIKYSNIVKQF